MIGILALALVVVFTAMFITVAFMQEREDRQRDRDAMAQIKKQEHNVSEKAAKVAGTLPNANNVGRSNWGEQRSVGAQVSNLRHSRDSAHKRAA